MSEVLLTQEAKLALFRKIFDGKLVHRGKLFRPTVEFYDQLGSNEELTAAAKQIYRWLGIKPYTLTVSFSEHSGIRVGHDRIEIPAHFQGFPYQSATCLALGVMRHVIAYRFRHHEVDDAFIEFATLESGLGIIVINGLCGTHSLSTRTYHFIQKHPGAHHLPNLSEYSRTDYAHEVVEYALRYRVPAEGWYPYVNNSARRLLRIKVTRSPHVLPLQERAYRHHSRQWWTKLWLYATLAAILITSALFILSQRPWSPSPTAADRYHDITVLESSVRICEKQVVALQNAADVNEIFNDININATKSRCQSLRNSYNYSVKLYNEELQR